jgi:heme A synthase
MAATKSQGRAFTLFMLGITVAAAGIAGYASGSGKLALVGGLVVLAVSFGVFLKIKPDEGEPAEKSQPVVLKLAGLGSAILGWIVVLFGLNLSSSVSGRMITTILGLCISLVGLLVLLPAAANKNAIWKA